ncbi:MAG TPA: YciI family protein [Longimicrobiales bacterium]
MRVVVFVKASQDSEAGVMPGRELIEEMGRFNQELADAGVLLAGEGLKASAEGKRVYFSGAQRRVVDGPFAETKELVAGFWVWKVKSLEEAVQWARRCPNPTGQEGQLEIRPIFEADDFGESFTPEERAKEEALRMRVGQQS